MIFRKLMKRRRGVVRGPDERPRGLSEEQPEDKKRREDDEKDEEEPDAKRAKIMTVGVEKEVFQVLMSALEQARRSVPILIHGNKEKRVSWEDEGARPGRKLGVQKLPVSARAFGGRSGTDRRSVTDETACTGG